MIIPEEIGNQVDKRNNKKSRNMSTRSILSSLLILSLFSVIHAANGATFRGIESAVTGNYPFILTDYDTMYFASFGLPPNFVINNIKFSNPDGSLTPNVNITLWYGLNGDKNIVPQEAGVNTNDINANGFVEWSPNLGHIDSSWFGTVAILTTGDMIGLIEVYINGLLDWSTCA